MTVRPWRWMTVQLVVLVMGSGCAERGVTRLPKIEGLRRITIEPYRLLVENDPESGCVLAVAGLVTPEADLRIGDSFAIYGPTTQQRGYQVLAIQPQAARLREQTLVDRNAEGMGVERKERVVEAPAYDLDAPPLSFWQRWFGDREQP